MSRYFSLHWDKNQKRSFFYRIYINIFGLFFRIPILPLKLTFKDFDFWRRGDTIIFTFPWAKKEGAKRYISVLSEGSFNSLKEIDEFWLKYEEQEKVFAQKVLDETETVKTEKNILFSDD